MSSLKSIYLSLVAAKSIIEDVIPELEGIAEYSKNELRKSKIILDEGLANFKQPVRENGAVVHVVQYEHGGIPDEPFLTMEMNQALDKFEELVSEHGFRKLKDGESINHYVEAYDHTLNEELDGDDVVRWWELELA